jgi:glycerol-3-phosphate cytidylyltransferase
MSEKKFELGYTAGAFDLFHVGHLRFLKRAAELCDKLIVGVSTTESMAEFKGVLPVISFNDRVEIIKSLPFVQYVVANEILEHEITRKRLGFDVFIIGDDWQGKLKSNIICPIVYLPRTEGISTTIIKGKL